MGDNKINNEVLDAEIDGLVALADDVDENRKASDGTIQVTLTASLLSLTEAGASSSTNIASEGTPAPLDVQSAVLEQDRTQLLQLMGMPIEVRNKIYEILLCNYSDAPKLSANQRLITYAKLDSKTEGLLRLRHDNHFQILGTCQQIYEEALYILRKDNLLIKLVIQMPRGEEHRQLLKELVAFGVPFLNPRAWNRHAADPKHRVMVHNISIANTELNYQSENFIFLRRDLPRFVSAIESLTFVTPPFPFLAEYFKSLT